MAKLFYVAYWKSLNNFLLRALAAGASAAAFALFLTVDYQDLSFKDHPELLCAFVVSVVACAYSVFHVFFCVLSNIVNFRFSRTALAFLHGLFFADQLLAYALLGSAAAAIISIKQTRDVVHDSGLKDTRINNALLRLLIGTSLEFLAFAAFALSSLMSGHHYINL